MNKALYEKLSKHVNNKKLFPDVNVRIANADLFSIGIDLFRKGSESVGRKICVSAMSAARIPNDLVIKILESLRENKIPRDYAAILYAHSQVKNYCK